MPSKISSNYFAAALRHRDIRFWIGSVGFFTLGSRALAVVIGFQVYKLTHSALALGWLGLIEAVPALSLVLIGGYVADHFSRHKILMTTRTCSCLCALALALLSRQTYTHSLTGLYSVIFLAGIARGFSDPATTAFEAQVVPKTITVNASSWIGSIWVSCSVIGPAIIGFVFAAWGAVGSYIWITAFFILSWFSTLAVGPKPQTIPKEKEPFFKSVSMGWRFVWGQQPLWGAMTLDLIAVLFGGVIALLPIYATDILHVGPQGLGLLNAATSVGALSMMLYATKHPPIAHAGRNLLLAVAGFGVSVLIFGFSRNFLLSLAALALSGVFDGVSMVIRRSMVRLLSPDDMRGRISAVSWIFICSSNELGAFESGMVAAAIGAIPCVALGGIVTLGVTVMTAWLAPQLRGLRFDPDTMERIYRP
ncbi:MAG: MFS transporter [Candidatus Omnitrophica bacterium]|nr:MFS transporter [Candidatus Omnitrophota bacterium]